MPIRSHFVTPESSQWRAWLDGLQHDFYHYPEYLQVSGLHEGGQPAAFLAEDGSGRRFLLPLLIRSLPGSDWSDASSPYGYPSPLLSAEDGEEEFLEEVLRILWREMRDRGIVSLFVRFHPLLPLPLGPFERQGRLIYHGQTVLMNLTVGKELLWAQLRGQYRTHIRRAGRKGYEAHFDREWTCFEQFFELYQATMRKVDAAACYFFPRDYFFGLREALKGGLHLGVVRKGSLVAAAALFTEVNGIVEYHLSGSREECRHDNPCKMLISSAAAWAADRGNKVLHLGGGRGAMSDSLLEFKSRFSPLRAKFRTWRAIVMPEAYSELCDRWQKQAGFPADEIDGFFPAYRREIPHAAGSA